MGLLVALECLGTLAVVPALAWAGGVLHAHLRP